MSDLQDVLKRPESISENKNTSSFCNICEKVFQNKNALTTHTKSDHPTFKPCRNFPDKCNFGENCNYNHIVLNANEDICWDCGELFSKKENLTW